MRFVDEAVIEVHAGNGGNGIVSFLRRRNLARGGPDGGNGGSGGDVSLVGDDALNTLIDFRFVPRYRATNGAHGGGRDRTGADGAGLDIRVPVGTTVIDEESRMPIGDVTQPHDALLVAKGGQRGLGNAHFKSSTNRAPRRATQGSPGESRRIRLSLKVMADAGLLGLPNAGKSTLISRVSAATPKVADYPFTTLSPNLGVVRVDDDASFVLADLPGLISGASRGAGLGFNFLKHLSRVPLLLHVVDAAPPDGGDPVANAHATEAELYAYSEGFRERETWMVANKLDLPEAGDGFARLRMAFPNRPCFGVSGATGHGLSALAQAAMAHVAAQRKRPAEAGDLSEPWLDPGDRLAEDVLAHTFAAAAKAPRHPPVDDPEAVYRR